MPDPSLLQRIRHAPPVDRALNWRLVRELIALVKRSSVVAAGRGRFVLHELVRRPGTRRYVVHGTHVPVLVRHCTPDIVTLDDVFLTRDYDMPPAVEARLRALPGPVRVLDLGANVGYFGAFVLAGFPDAEILGYEPDPANAAVLRRAIEISASEGRWSVVEAAADRRDGQVAFVHGHYSTSHILAPGEAAPDSTEVTAVDVLPRMDEADLVKFDIEGGEWEILTDPRFASVSASAVVVEYHPERCPEPDPLAAAGRLLAQAGYEVQPTTERPGGQGVVWGWREAR